MTPAATVISSVQGTAMANRPRGAKARPIPDFTTVTKGTAK